MRRRVQRLVGVPDSVCLGFGGSFRIVRISFIKILSHIINFTAVNIWLLNMAVNRFDMAVNRFDRFGMVFGFHDPNVTVQGTRHFVEGTLEPIVRIIIPSSGVTHL